MEKIHTFKSFSQVREEAAKIKQLKEVSNKQSQSIERYNSLLREYGIASPGELEEEKRNEFFSKLVESVDSSFIINEGTRGQIGTLDKSGKITTTYVHYGSVSMVSDFLRKNGGKEAKELLKLGKAGISFLGSKITSKNDFNNPDNSAACFYGRDRGEVGNSMMVGKVDNLKKFVNDVKGEAGAEYLYLWDEATSKWLFMDTYEDETLQVFESNTTFDVNEAISRSAISRMEGLVLIKEMKQLLDVASVIIKDFVETEDFEFDECVEFIAYKIEDHLAGVYEGKSVKTSEGNAFGAAVTKAKEDEKDEFEFQGKTFKVTEAEEILEVKSINKIQNDWTKVTSEMVELAKEWKAAEGDAKTALLTKMKEKTAVKKTLEAELDAAVAGKDKDLELVVSEGNGFNTALFAARNKGEKTFEFNGKTYKVTARKVNEEEIEEGNAFGAAVTKAKEAGEKEFEFDGKTYKVEESKYNPSIKIVKEQINEAKQFDKDLDSMIKDIKRGVGWIDPEYVGDSWENSSDAIDFSIVKAEVFKKLLDAGVLYFSDDSGEEKGNAVKLADLGAIMKMYESNVAESAITEAEVKSDEEFKEYAFTVLKKAFGDDFDEAKAQEVVDGILAKADGDFGAAIGMLTSGLG